MRLSDRIIRLIKDNIYKAFGEVDIILFGSRTDEQKKGGDIDLAINVDISREEFRQKKVKLITCLVMQDFDIKIDLIQMNQANELLLSEIKSSGIRL